MSETIRRWVQTVVGIALIAFALRFEQEPTRRLELVGLGALLIDGEHVLKAIGLWKGGPTGGQS